MIDDDDVDSSVHRHTASQRQSTVGRRGRLGRSEGSSATVKLRSAQRSRRSCSRLERSLSRPPHRDISHGRMRGQSNRPGRSPFAYSDRSRGMSGNEESPGDDTDADADDPIYIGRRSVGTSPKRSTGPRTLRQPSAHVDTAPHPKLEDLRHRLHALLDEVIAVLQSYSLTLHPSARRVQALHSFYDRTYDLLNPPSPDLFIHSSHRADATGGERGMTLSHVQRLEREWWESELVAVWYGPRPRPASLNPLPSPSPRLPLSPLRMDIGGAGEAGDGPGGPLSNANQRNREALVKKDASYVGLYDE